MSVEELAWREVTLQTCYFYAKQVRRSESELSRAVNAARQSGCSWSEIAVTIGVSHQAAIKRFSGTVEHVDLRRRESPRRAEVRARNGWKDPEGNDAA